MPKKAAKIDVNITNFVDLSVNKAFSTATFTLGANPPAGIAQVGQNFEISDNLRLIFRFNQAAFKPVDIMFAQITGSCDDDGTLNLTGRVKQRKNNGNWVIVVQDMLVDGGAAGTQNACAWKFFIAIQRVADGKIGIIDPEVSNTDQE